MKKLNRWQRFKNSRLFPVLWLLLFVIVLAGAVFWWYKYRWNLPLDLARPSASSTAVNEVSKLVIVVSAGQITASDDFAKGAELTLELRDQNGVRMKANGEQIITLASNMPDEVQFEGGDIVTIKDGDFSASTRLKATKAGVVNITATSSTISPASASLTVLAGEVAGLAPVSLRGSNSATLSQQTEYSFETRLVDRFGNPVEQASTVNWQVMSDPAIYPIATDKRGMAIFNYVFTTGPQRAEVVRASLGAGHQDYTATVVP